MTAIGMPAGEGTGQGRQETGPRTGDPAASGEGSPRRNERLLVLGGTVVGILGGLVTGIIEAFYAPLAIGATRIPVSPVLAVVGNAALVWFTYRVTRSSGPALLPGVAWFAVMVLGLTGTHPAQGRTTEGDRIFAGDNWVVLLLITAGSLAWAIAGARVIAGHRPAAPRPPSRTGRP